MRYLGIDYGTKKVGLALSDENGTMGFPHKVVPNDDELLPYVCALIEKEGVEAVVVGESLDFEGQENDIMPDARIFADLVSVRTGAKLAYEPEVFTSAEARRGPGAPDEKKSRKPQSNEPVDAKAAALILTSYLSRHAVPEA